MTDAPPVTMGGCVGFMLPVPVGLTIGLVALATGQIVVVSVLMGSFAEDVTGRLEEGLGVDTVG